jgi:hypothetical protein
LVPIVHRGDCVAEITHPAATPKFTAEFATAADAAAAAAANANPNAATDAAAADADANGTVAAASPTTTSTADVDAEPPTAPDLRFSQLCRDHALLQAPAALDDALAAAAPARGFFLGIVRRARSGAPPSGTPGPAASSPLHVGLCGNPRGARTLRAMPATSPMAYARLMGRLPPPVA